MEQIRGGWWNRYNIYLIVTTILFALVCTWVIHNIEGNPDSEGTTDDVRTTMMGKGSKKLDQVDSKGGKRETRNNSA